MSLVSCIIPVYNRSAYLEAAVESVVAQTYRPIELLIIDDGSDEENAREFDALAARHPTIIEVVRQENAGPGAARENGRLRAGGEFIQYLDSDDLLMPNKFADQVQALRAHPECGIAYGYTSLIDHEGSLLSEQYKDSGLDHPYLFPRLLSQRWWNTHTPLYRRSVCEQIGPWPRMRMGEDWLYEARAAALDVQLINCHSEVARTRMHGGERLTGGGHTPAVMKDLSLLLSGLHRCALRSTTPISPDEWDVFFRWTFLETRRAAGLGMNEEVQELRKLLEQAPSDRLRTQVHRYFSASRVIGPRLANLVVESASVLKRTLKDRVPREGA